MTHSRYFYTTRKGNHSATLIPRVVGGRRPLPSEICAQIDPPPSTRGSAIAEEPRDALRQLKYYGRFLTELLTRSSANPEEPCEHTVS